MRFDEFYRGQVIDAGPYPITEADIVEFAGRYDPQWFHTDPEAAARGRFEGLIASGWHTCAMAMRMICDHYLLQSASPVLPGIGESKWRAPVRPGDILTMKRECLSRRPSESQREMGHTRFRHTMTNQHGEVKMILEGEMCFARRDAEAGT